MNTTSTLENIAFLHRILNPTDKNPAIPSFSPAISDYIVAGLLRDISVSLHNREFAASVHSIGRELASTSAHGLTADWEGDGDGAGPVHPKPWWVFLVGMEVVTFSTYDLIDGDLDPNGRPRWPRLDGSLRRDDLSTISHLVQRLLDPSPIGPRLEPWFAHATPAMNDIILAHALRQLASLTANEKASNAINAVGESIVKSASAKLFDEYRGTVVHRDLPPPKHKAPAA